MFINRNIDKEIGMIMRNLKHKNGRKCINNLSEYLP